jgi:signal transduction histidine kinase
VPLLAAIMPIAVTVYALLLRDALLRPGFATLAATIAVGPWLIDVATTKIGYRRALPRWLFSLIVLIGVGLLVWYPPRNDVAATVLVFLTAEMAARMRWPWGINVFLGSCAVMIGANVFGHYSGSAPWIMGFGFAFFGGSAVQSQLRLANELKAAQAGLAEKAADEERSRIAREVHDVIAHSMSVTMLHVTAARMALEKGQSVEGQGRNSLIDIRRTVGLLGPDESGAAPMPGVMDLPKLVTDFRNAGLDVTLSMNGAVDELPPAAGLNLYRIVQESLTNASKHASGAKTSVELTVTDTDIRLRVFNEAGNGNAPAADAGGGRGFRGMVERAVMLNGSLVSGSEAGGWLVVLAAPRPTEE